MRLLIFDFDGTLADTGKVILQTISQTLEQLKCQVPACDELKSLIGLPLAKIFENACHSPETGLISEAVRIYRARFPENCKNNVELYPGVRQTLNAFKEDGISLAIASSREKNSLLSLINQLDLASDFSIIAGEQDVKRHKPEPDIARFVLEQANVPAHSALFIGDTIFDIKAGKAAGIKTCGVGYGNHSASQLFNAGADYVIDEFPKLERIVRKNR